MKRRRGILAVTLLMMFTASGAVVGQAADQTATVKGWVLDSACAFTHNLRKPISTLCAVSCAKAGSPLVILTDAGTIYWPISGEMPAKGQNDRLMEYAGKRVLVTGKVFTKGGSHGVVIEKIEAVEAKK
ncbi:MAG: hypothetical protein ABSB82_14500 [Terriglobia bacterium]|jgi:hypothetical protein